MLLTEDDVKEFMEACTADGFTLTPDEARICALRVMRLYELLARPLPEETALAKMSDDATLEAQKVPPSQSSPAP
jgi:hypothetical protein